MKLDPRIRQEHIAKYGVNDTERYLAVVRQIPALPDDKRGENHHLLAQSIWPKYANLKANPWNRLRVSRAVHVALTELQAEFEEHLTHAVLMMKGQTLEAQLAACIKGGKRSHELHPNLASRMGVLGGKRTHELYPDMAREIGIKTGKISGRIAVESGQLANIATPESCSKGGKRTHELYPNLASERGKRTQRLYPNLSSENGKKSGKYASKITHALKNEDGKSVHAVKMGMIGGKIGGKRTHELHPNQSSENAKKNNCSRWNIRRGKPCTCGKH